MFIQLKLVTVARHNFELNKLLKLLLTALVFLCCQNVIIIYLTFLAFYELGKYSEIMLSKLT